MSYVKSSEAAAPLPEFPSTANSIEVAVGHGTANASFNSNLSLSGMHGQYMTNKSNYTRPPPKNVVERIVEVPKVYYKQVLKERIVEVPQVQTEVVLKEVVVPEKYDVPIVQPREVPVEQRIERNVPVPVDVMTTLKFAMPQLVPKYTVVKERIVVPRYIEVAVPTHIVQVEEFEKSMVPGPPIKDYVWPQNALENEHGEVFQSLMAQSVTVNGANDDSRWTESPTK
ncbi:hypothetical protein IE077_000997 [Cardiosporidium cionae]|uniref:Uncharacterized protein n=1 Tax=Cardiosporidium cionae TaxID=476202 RepID=A0ABQ7JDP0_9APIC|nr:hypothetical protein IE077_000997 [Cardiosporidium cionae]|eukprot:KAF8822118.1 hypothetical protein IE077_000997 [Cardiosporidium cionae]